jgi:hypothetical protein
MLARQAALLLFAENLQQTFAIFGGNPRFRACRNSKIQAMKEALDNVARPCRFVRSRILLYGQP